MDQKQEISERETLRRSAYAVPEGYFDGLQTRLRAIPQQDAVRRGRLLAAVSACAAAAAILCALLVSRPAALPLSPSYEQMACAGLIPYTEPYIYYASSQDGNDAGSFAEELGANERLELLDYLMQRIEY